MRVAYPNEMVVYGGELYHYGIKGQKWGVRRFENSDGTLTAAGRERYGRYADSREKKQWKKTAAFEKHMAKQESKAIKKVNKASKKLDKLSKKNDTAMSKRKAQDRLKKAEAVMKRVQNMSDKFYKLDEGEQMAISRGYKRARNLTIAGGVLFGLPAAAVVGGFSQLTVGQDIKRKLT